MSDAQVKQLFPSLNQFLGLPEGNIEEELTNEQFYALVLAYNDKISGKKREQKTTRLGKSLYELSDEEKVGLELAFKSGINANYSEEDVVKKISSLCNNEVCEILQTKNSRQDKIKSLHNKAVARLTEKGEKIGSFGYYKKVTQVAEDVNGEVCKDNFKKDCQFLDNIASLIQDPNKLKVLASQCDGNIGIDEMRERLEQSTQKTLENIYTHIRKSVNCEVGFDAYNACQNLNDNVQVG